MIARLRLDRFLHFFLVMCTSAYKSLERVLLSLGNTKFANSYTERVLKAVLRKADIKLNGPKEYDIQVKNDRFIVRVMNNPSLGLGEGYMDGDWDIKNLEEFSYMVFKHNLSKQYLIRSNRLVNYLLFNVVNLQTKERAWEVGQKHYDLGNELFESFLDPTMNYSCGYWRNAKNLNEAQINKMDLIARKLKLEPGMKVLDIGCGWGGLCKYLAENYGVKVVGVTVSTEQGKIAAERCSNLDVDIRLCDYRDVDEKFDRIVSVGMFEHVGTTNYSTFFDVCRRCLTDEGILLLHTIGTSDPNVPLIEPWFHKYIFPNGKLPYHTDIPKYIDGKFVLEDWHNFGYDYSKTLRAWRENFVRNWPKLEKKADSKFYRMWYYYLSMCCGAFKARKYQLWQLVLTKNGYPGGYQSER